MPATSAQRWRSGCDAHTASAHPAASEFALQVFQSFVRELANPALSEQTKLLMLRTAATTHYYTSEQACACVG